MRLSFRPRIPAPAPSRAHWLQFAACAVLAWAWLHAIPAIYIPPAIRTPPPVAPQAEPTPPLVAPPAETAPPGPKSTDVIVQTHDTLDSIFRRLKIDLGDLASLRALPGLKRMLDGLRPGEALHL